MTKIWPPFRRAFFLPRDTTADRKNDDNTRRWWLGCLVAFLGIGACWVGFVEALPVVVAISPLIIGGGFFLMHRKREAPDCRLPLKMLPIERRERDTTLEHHRKWRGRR